MKMQFKGIKIGRLIISTKSKIENSEFSVDSKEIWELFKKAVNENKIIFTSNSEPKGSKTNKD